jgi:hypothetical protein
MDYVLTLRKCVKPAMVAAACDVSGVLLAMRGLLCSWQADDSKRARGL